MFDKKKKNFWLLAIIFIAITITILFSLWNSPQASQRAAMMNTSMGNMMKSMHLSNLKIYDLFNQEIEQQISEAENHHATQASVIYQLNFISTAVIFFLLPFIIGGTILLAIVWVR